MVCTLIDHRSDVNMFKTQVEPRTTGKWFHCKVFEHFEVMSMVDIRVKPWKMVVDLFFTITFKVTTSISIEVSQKIVHMIKRKQIKPFSWSILLLNIIIIIIIIMEFISRLYIAVLGALQCK